MYKLAMGAMFSKEFKTREDVLRRIHGIINEHYKDGEGEYVPAYTANTTYTGFDGKRYDVEVLAYHMDGRNTTFFVTFNILKEVQ